MLHTAPVNLIQINDNQNLFLIPLFQTEANRLVVTLFDVTDY